MFKKIKVFIILFFIIIFLLPITRDELHWQFALLKDKVENYAGYLAEWPEGRHLNEARSRYDERNWADTQAANTLEHYRQYQQNHPTGTHLPEAKARIEELVWQQSVKTNTFKSLQHYIQTYPTGRFIREAHTRQAKMLADEKPFQEAMQKGTEHALQQFLKDFPGHRKEREARRAIEILVENQEIVSLLNANKIEVRSRGVDIQHVSIQLRKLVPDSLIVRIPAGTYFVADNQTTQNMVSTASTQVELVSNHWQDLSIPVACANRPKGIPRQTDTFTIQRSPHQEELSRLMPVLDQSDAHYAVRQAAVWIVTDDASYAELGSLVSGFGFGGSRVIDMQDALQAMKICDDAGIDIQRKKIWRDQLNVLEAIKEQDGFIENSLKGESLSSKSEQEQKRINSIIQFKNWLENRLLLRSKEAAPSTPVDSRNSPQPSLTPNEVSAPSQNSTSGVHKCKDAKGKISYQTSACVNSIEMEYR